MRTGLEILVVLGLLLAAGHAGAAGSAADASEDEAAGKREQ
jgi:hypothetical protein